ncbi:50S ribosomal protein L29 [uncultured Lamprocystis sp.]|jgi:large subunit ribosomal protein L29|uniref:50S ribosomal protein L29 n=1 Tax=uncultured Lamprocystis sp. TaxID=543132 RepID=UPI0025E7FBBA|nr:50S ribosomal protein L29 [uncultured Lamprocystis sp.]
MKAKELRTSSTEALQQQLEGLLREQFNLRMQRGVGQLTRPSRMKAVRRDIARVKMVMAEQTAGGQS